MSNGDGDWTGGAIAADEVRGTTPASWPENAKRAVALHRHLDAFTDTHLTARVTRRHFPEFRHYARVLVDVYYDHALARHFNRFSPEPLEVFAQRIYGELDTARDWLPEPLRTSVPRMIADDFLVRYRTTEHVRRTLAHLSKRFRREVDLTASLAIQEDLQEEIDDEALRFLPEMVDEARRYRRTIP